MEIISSLSLIGFYSKLNVRVSNENIVFDFDCNLNSDYNSTVICDFNSSSLKITDLLAKIFSDKKVKIYPFDKDTNIDLEIGYDNKQRLLYIEVLDFLSSSSKPTTYHFEISKEREEYDELKELISLIKLNEIERGQVKNDRFTSVKCYR